MIWLFYAEMNFGYVESKSNINTRTIIMKTIQHCLLLLVFMLPIAQESNAQKYIEFGSPLDFIKDEGPGLFANYITCIQNGHAEGDCQRAAALCAINSYPIGGVMGTFISELELMQVFKRNCGDDQCYQCCHRPGFGCHTSFIGFPVINCNYNYGPGTNAAGITLITDPDAMPGDPCLFTPQTCVHIAKCNAHKDPASIQAINDDPMDIMKSQHAIEQRALVFAENQLTYQWNAFLSDFATVDTDTTEPLSLQDFDDFVLARGNEAWINMVNDFSNFDWDDPQFAMVDTNTMEFLPGLSHYNGIRQLGVMRILSAVPNLSNRLGFVESYIWLEDKTDTYLDMIGDPDSILRSSMSPFALDFFKENSNLQDYRLLAVPADGELLDPNVYNGRQMGKPAKFIVHPTVMDQTGIQFELELLDAGTYNSEDPLGLTVVWGDGSVDNYFLEDLSALPEISHTYEKGGSYQTITMLQNHSGLRAIAKEPIQTATQEVNTSAEVQASISKIIFKGLGVEYNSLAGNDYDFQYIVHGITEQDKSYRIGQSALQSVEKNVPKSFGHLYAYNGHNLKFSSIVLEGYRKQQGFAIGFRNIGCTFEGILAEIYDPVQDAYVQHELPILKENIWLHPIDETLPAYHPDTIYRDSSAYRIIIHTTTDYISKIEFELDYDILDILPPQHDDWLGVDDFLWETRPGTVITKDLTSATHEANSAAHFTLDCQPNPFEDAFQIILNMKSAADVEIELFNNFGQLQFQTTLDKLEPGVHEIPMQTQNLKTGVYFLVARKDGMPIRQKLIKVE